MLGTLEPPRLGLLVAWRPTRAGKGATPSMEQRPLDPRTPVEVIAMGVKLYLSNLGMFLNTVALIVIPAAVIGMLIQMAAIPGSTQVIEGELVFADDDALATFAATAGITSFIAVFLGILATAAITKAVADQYLGRTPSIADSLAFARGRWGSLL